MESSTSLKPASQAGQMKLFLFFLFLTTASIPIPIQLYSYVIVLFSVAALTCTNWLEKKAELQRNRFWIIPAMYFVWLLIASLLNLQYPIKYVEGYTTFLVIPIVLTVTPRLSYHQFKIACLSFIVVVVALTMVAIIRSWIEYQHLHDTRLFSYHYLSQQVGLNAIFLSNFCVVSISWLIYYRFILAKRSRPWVSALLLLIAGYLSLVVFLLSSKMIIAIFLIEMIALALLIGYSKRRIGISVFILLAFLTMAGIAASQFPYLNWRLRVTEFKQYDGPADNQNGFAARLFMWESAAKVIGDRPVIGHGIVGAKEEIMKRYREKDFELGVSERYNSHNQYLETTMMSGIIGLALFVTILILLARQGWRTRNILLLLLLFHYVMLSMVEATLEIQQEFVFFFFFLFFFYFQSPAQILFRQKSIFGAKSEN